MVKKLSQGNRIGYTFSKWICDEVDDISNIPRGSMGDTVFVIHTKDTYMMDSQGKWYNITSEGDPIDCNCVEEMTVWADIPTN